jgi:hypothetical protein
MKYLAYFTTITATVITSLIPASATAEGLISQVLPPAGSYSSTTIYLPSGESTTTTTTERVIINNDPNYNSFPTSTTTTTYYSGNNYIRQQHQYRQYHQPKVVFPQSNIYLPAIQSRCSTSVIGSPIPSAIPLDRHTGMPCQ